MDYNFLLYFLISIIILNIFSLYEINAILIKTKINNYNIDDFFENLLLGLNLYKSNKYVLRYKILVILYFLLFVIVFNIIILVVALVIMKTNSDKIVFSIIVSLLTLIFIIFSLSSIINSNKKYKSFPIENETECVEYFNSLEKSYDFSKYLNIELIFDGSVFRGNNNIVYIKLTQKLFKRKLIELKENESFLKYMYLFKKYLSFISRHGKKVNWLETIIIKIDKNESTIDELKKALISNFLYFKNNVKGEEK
ncbi:hypothetical protein SLITO_v1c09560 [Spiroplasma litorale]|uniref:Uncharacterized protein n=1 Tax=Spiroplasma litorale TaxID=216942 RepID=A0A0K1W382_9MOLU|nr:hypothetical protein [Spiroplasma litorale]AKX34567.1 hypothetical protein SLITO_v1c09560 [Spiroplasma litorale]